MSDPILPRNVTGANRLRIIGGRWRRRILQFPSALDLRPTPDRVRETLFNWLGQTLDGEECLDLFAGSGALGFEAASRGARQVVMVESNRTVYSALAANTQLLEGANIEVRCEDAFTFLETNQRMFDVVFLDPPYRQEWLPRVLARLKPRLAHGARVYLEAQRLPEVSDGYAVMRSGKAGQVKFLLLESTGHDNEV